MEQVGFAKRIASLLASATEILYGLDVGDRVVAVSHECDYPAQVAGKPRVTRAEVDPTQPSRDVDATVRNFSASGKALYTIDTPRLAELRPDLIVTQAQCEVCAVSLADVIRATRDSAALRHARIVALNPATLEDIFSDILRIGEAAGVGRRAQGYAAGLRERVEAVRSKTRDIPPPEKPSVAFLEWIEPVIFGANWMPELIEIAGGRSELSQPGSQSAYGRWEDLIDYAPDVIIAAPCGLDLHRTIDGAASLCRKPGWSDLAAVQRGRVFATDGNAYFNRSGPRIVDSLEILAGLLHPELFAAFATTYQRVWRRIV